MTAEEWQTANSQYLSASLAWLRLRMQQLAQPEAGPAIAPFPEVVGTSPSQSTLFKRLFGGQAAGDIANSTEKPMLLLEDHGVSLEEEISQAQAERMSIAAQMQPAPALALLGQQLGLSAFEQDILLLCAAPELDTRAAAV